jgi:hypothetical protein
LFKRLISVLSNSSCITFVSTWPSC